MGRQLEPYPDVTVVRVCAARALRVEPAQRAHEAGLVAAAVLEGVHLADVVVLGAGRVAAVVDVLGGDGAAAGARRAAEELQRPHPVALEEVAGVEALAVERAGLR